MGQANPFFTGVPKKSVLEQSQVPDDAESPHDDNVSDPPSVVIVPLSRQSNELPIRVLSFFIFIFIFYIEQNLCP